MHPHEIFPALKYPIAYYPELVPLCGSVNAALYLTQVLYWTGKQHDPDGWIFKRVKKREAGGESREPENQYFPDELGMSSFQARNAGRQLIRRGLIEQQYRRSEHRSYLRANLKTLRQRGIEFGLEQAPSASQPGQKSSLPDQKRPVQAGAVSLPAWSRFFTWLEQFLFLVKWYLHRLRTDSFTDSRTTAKGDDLSIPEKDPSTSSASAKPEGEDKPENARAPRTGDRRSAAESGLRFPPEWNFAHGLPVTAEQLALERRRDAAIAAFESAFHVNRWPWAETPVWDKMLALVMAEYQQDPGIFRAYVEWMEGEGKYTAMNVKQIRIAPQQFIDTGWPMFMASRRSREPEAAPAETDLMRRIRERKEANERAKEH